jgi:hypothetical protein
MWLPALEPEPEFWRRARCGRVVPVNPGVTWLRWTRLDDVAADGEPVDDRGAQLRDPRSRGPSPDQLGQRSRTAATTLAS